jgi:hypothetical protein
MTPQVSWGTPEVEFLGLSRGAALDRKALELYYVKNLLLRESDERLTEEAAGPSDIQRLRCIGDVGCSRDRGVVRSALARAQDRGHTPDTHGVIRGWACDLCLGR